MLYDRKRHHRRSIRLKGYDYSQAGAYFVTIRTKNGECVLGDIIGGKMKLSALGKVADRFWLQIPEHFLYVELDEFKVMPNHIHGIILIWNVDNPKPSGRGVQLNTPTDYFSKISPKKKSLSVIIRTYKAVVTTWCRKNGFKNFRWQSNYYDHIIRNARSLDRIRSYISTNPQRWELDRENPDRTAMDPFDLWFESHRPLRTKQQSRFG